MQLPLANHKIFSMSIKVTKLSKHFGTQKAVDEIYFEAKLLNFSEGGVYFKTDHDLKPGATIFLKMNMVSSSKINSLDPEHPRSVSLGEVKWRMDLSGSDQSCYGVGVRYPFPN